MRTETNEFEFTRDSDGWITVDGAVFQALGAASVCWVDSPGDLGIFDSERAKAIGEQLIALIWERMAPREDVDRRRLRQCTDASVWAAEFAKVRPDVDRGLMLGWFANAIEETRTAVTSDRAELGWDERLSVPECDGTRNCRRHPGARAEHWAELAGGNEIIHPGRVPQHPDAWERRRMGVFESGETA